MQLLLAILLYLRVIASPGTYTEKQIEMFIEHNEARIEAVRNDKVQMDKVEEVYVPQTEGVVIIFEEND